MPLFLFEIAGITISTLHHLKWLLNTVVVDDKLNNRSVQLKFVDVRTTHHTGDVCLGQQHPSEPAVLRRAFDRGLRYVCCIMNVLFYLLNLYFIF